MSIEYDKEIVEPPKYLTLSILEEIIENASRQSNVNIKSAKFSMGSVIGENYCSQIYRIKFQYQLPEVNGNEIQNLSVIVKSMPSTEATEFLLDLKVYLKEKIIYMEVLPRLEMLLEDGKRFGPRLYHSLKHPINTLVFEDLNIQGFQLASRESGLDETHGRLVLQRLGEYHATSIILYEKDPDILKGFTEGLLGKMALERDNNMLLKYFGGTANELIELVNTWKGYENITQKLRKYVANLKENLLGLQATNDNGFKVLNHGDLWVNNILFKYDDKHQLKDVIFLDFQMGIWNSPGIDLNYFLNTSLQLEVLKNKRELLIEIYYQSLRDTLQRFNYTKVPTYKTIREEVQRYEPFGFFANFSIYPTICMNKEISCDNALENFLNDDFLVNKFKQMFQSKQLHETFKFTLKRFDKLGIWD